MELKEKSKPSELTAVLNRNFFEQAPVTCDTPERLARWTAFREQYHRAQKLEFEGEFPLQMDFELNSHCNMKCSFCLHGNEDIPAKLMDFGLFKKAIDEGSTNGLVSIKLNYINEPLLRRDIWKFIEYAQSKGVLNIYFATNGTRLTETNSRRLIESRVSKIMVSLDALTEPTFKLMRNSGKFEEIKRNVSEFLAIREEMGALNPLLRVNFVKSRLNIHEAEEFIDYWEGKVDSIGLQDLVSVPNVANKNESPTKKNFRCSFPFKLCVIDSNGDILPCCTFSGREMPIGNISNSTVKEAWESKKRRALLETHKAGRYEDNAICKHCINSGGVD